ncbi:MAG: type II toxin-antitoxin system VapC family toxin [Methanotrichaceae archaeon]|nr:type II toxin-antitoxin system VapC family toxin [Methanotrichaceae archaeon]
MRDRAVLDSSVIAALFFREEASSRARKSVAELDPITLDLAFSEVGNVAWKQVVFSNEKKELAMEALRDSFEFIAGSCLLLRSSDLLFEAFLIGVEDRVPLYDSLFLAAAEREGVPLLTLDRRLHDSAIRSGKDVRIV